MDAEAVRRNAILGSPRVVRVVRASPGVPFERARIRPVRDPQHLYNTIRYIFRQEQHHGIVIDPLHDASSLPELLGLRSLPAEVGWGDVVVRVRRLLPRLRTADLLRLFDESVPEASGLWSRSAAPQAPVHRHVTACPMPSPPIVPLPYDATRDAIAAAAGLATLDGRGKRLSLARIAGSELLLPSRGPRDLATILQISRRTGRRLHRGRAPRQLVRAVELQLGVRGLQNRPEGG